MAKHLELWFQSASEGDAIWVRWGAELERQLLIDMGQKKNGKEIRTRLEALPQESRRFELLVVTHVDEDHIGGIMTGLVEQPDLPGLTFGDVWFNGWLHINGKQEPKPGGLVPQGPKQGTLFGNWLSEPWNEAFDRGPVIRTDPLTTSQLDGDMVVTVIGPPAERFAALVPVWEAEVKKAIAGHVLTPEEGGLVPMGAHKVKPTRPDLQSEDDLEDLAGHVSTLDSSEANGTSIAVVLEWEGRRVLLCGDAWGVDVQAGVEALPGPAPRAMDVVKLPHHGSQANVTDGLLDAMTSRVFVASTNGGKYFHPDAEAIARVVRRHRSPRPSLGFNVPSEFNGWWTNPAWQQLLRYDAQVGTPADGIRIRLEAGNGAAIQVGDTVL